MAASSPDLTFPKAILATGPADSGPQQTPVAAQVVQYANGNGSMGIPNGWFRTAANLSAMAVIAGSFLYLQFTLITQNRADRAEDRVMFKEELREIRGQQDRHIGEIKGSMDANTASMRELTNELRRAKPPT